MRESTRDQAIERGKCWRPDGGEIEICARRSLLERRLSAVAPKSREKKKKILKVRSRGRKADDWGGKSKGPSPCKAHARYRGGEGKVRKGVEVNALSGAEKDRMVTT